LIDSDDHRAVGGGAFATAASVGSCMRGSPVRCGRRRSGQLNARFNYQFNAMGRSDLREYNVGN